MAWNSVGQANVNGRLAMTRSIGDFDLKKNGVIAEPETTRTLVGTFTTFYSQFGPFKMKVWLLKCAL